MAIHIFDLRLTLIWVETYFDLLGDLELETAPLAFLGRRYKFGPKFEQAITSKLELLGLEPPWPEKSKQLFWYYYLEGNQLGLTKGEQAWKALLPLRGKVPAKIESPEFTRFISSEVFYYPYGLALVVTWQSQAQLLLKEAIEKVFELRRNYRYQVKWAKDDIAESISLDVFADRAIVTLRQIALGQEAASTARISQPFSVFTVVQGTGVDPGESIPSGQQIHRLLEAVTGWRPTYQYDSLPDLAEASIKIRRAPQGHILYAGKRGRAVWFPGLFTNKVAGQKSLTCYHRNLVFTSLQTESLSNFIEETAKWIRSGKTLSVTHRECARRAAGILGRLYGGAASTYQSWSSRAQIEQNYFVEAIDEVRDFFNMPPLS